MYNFHILIESLGVFLGIVLSVVLFTVRHGNIKANRYLSICLLFLSISMFLHVADHVGFIPLPQHNIIVNLFCLLYGPLMLFYLLELINPGSRLSFKRLVHFSVFLIFLLLFLPVNTIFYKTPVYEYLEMILGIIFIIHILIYLIAMLVFLLRYVKSLKDSFSSIERKTLNWLRYLLFAFTIIWIASMVIKLFRIDGGDFIWILVAVLMYTIGYFALWQKLIESPNYWHLKLAEIGFDVGYNSLSSFNSAFKKVTSVTPSKYREKYLK